MATLEIIIQRRSETGIPVIAMETRAGEFLPVRSEGSLQLDEEALRGCALPAEYGNLLGKALFRDELRDGFTRALGQANTAGEPLHVLITVEDAMLKPIHWERLHAPYTGGWDFLAMHQETPFSIYLPSLTDRRYPAIGRRDLRALLVVAGPGDLANEYGLEPIDSAAAVAAVRGSLGGLPCDVLAGIPGADGLPNLNTLCERITAGRYALLHIVCHARVSTQSGETVLYLPGDGGRPITASTLIERLGRLKATGGLPHFVFLMACESAAPEVENGLGGLGQRLVRELGLPAVLAMTGPVSTATAGALAAGFYSYLADHGQPDLALAEALAGLMGQYDASVPAIFSRLGGRALFSDTLDRPLTPAETRHGLERLVGLLPERAPALQDTAKALVNRLDGLADETGLSPDAGKERGNALTVVNAIAEQVLVLSFPALALGHPVPPYDARCPFPGLAPFRPEDRAFFFGREKLVQTLAQRVHEHPFLAVLGASGSGKSSAVLAGLVPTLGEHLYITPGADPLERLRAALEQQVSPSALLVVDQFEEIFTLCRDESSRRAFLDDLLTQVGPRPVVITMRADFLGECAPYPILRTAIQAHTEIVAPMDGAELRRAIEQQAAATGLRFEADLAEDILEDVGAADGRSLEPGAMPLLQHATLLLWQRRRGRWLLLSEYRAFGTVREAIAHTAGQIYDSLDPLEREQMRAIFLRLTRLDDDETTAGNTTEEHRDTRRRATLDELVPAQSSREAILRLVSRLADARLVISGTNPVTGKVEVEVAHEALIRHWPLLRRWLQEDRAALRLAENIREAAHDWDAEQRDENLLVHRGGRLEDALALAGEIPSPGHKYPLNQLELDYVHACRNQVEKERRSTERRRRATLIAALVVALMMTVLAVYGVSSARDAQARATEVAFQAQTAESNRILAVNNAATATVALGLSEQRAQEARSAQSTAEAQARVSLSRQLAVQAPDIIENHPFEVDTAALMAIGAYTLHPEPQTSLILSDVLDLLPQPAGQLDIGLVSNMVISPNDQWLVTSKVNGDASGDGYLIQAWSRTNGQPAWQARVANPVERFLFSADSRVLVSAEKDGSIRAWDTTSGAQVHEMVLGEAVSQIAIRPDGKLLLVNGEKGSNVLWNIESGKEVSRESDRKIKLVAFSPDNRWAVTCDGNGVVKVWDPDSGKAVADFPVPLQGQDLPDCLGVAFPGDSVRVLLGQSRTRLMLWDVMSKNEIFKTELGESYNSVQISLNGETIAIDAGIGDVHLLGGTTGAEFRQFIHKQIPYAIIYSGLPMLSGDNQVSSILISHSGDYLYTTGYDLTVRLWSVRTGQEINRAQVSFGDGGENFIAVAINPDTRLVATYPASDYELSPLGAGTAGMVQFKRMISANEQVHVLGAGIVTGLALSQDGRLVIGGTADQKAAAWDVATGQALGSAQHKADVMSLALAPDGERAVSADGEGNILVWETRTGKIITSMREPSETTQVIFSSDGRRVVSGNQEGVFVAWDADNGKVLGRITNPQSYYLFSLSPDGQTVAFEGDNTNLLVTANLLTRQEYSALSENSLFTMIISPDGQSLAVTYGDSKVAVWDLTLQKRTEYETQSDIMFLLFSSDSRILAAGGAPSIAKNSISVFDLQTGKLLAEETLETAETPLMSPDGKFLLRQGSPDQIFELATGKTIVHLKTGKFNTIGAGGLFSDAIKFSPDGRSIISADDEGDLVVQVWQPADSIALACQRGTIALTEDLWKTTIGEQVPFQATCGGQ